MTNGFAVRGYFADQGAPQAFGKSVQFTALKADLYFLTAINKSASVVYIELYDSASGVSGTPRVLPCLPASGGGFCKWEEIRMRSGIFVRAVDAASGGTLIAGDDVQFDCGFGERNAG